MYCTKCGTINKDDAKFCANCGEAMAPVDGRAPTDQPRQQPYPPQQSRPTNPNHPYHRLGGWLAVLCYGLLIGAVLLSLQGVIAAFNIFSYASYLGFKAVFSGLLVIAIFVPGVYCSYQMHSMIKRRDPSFLRFYELTMLIYMGADVFLMLFANRVGFLILPSRDIGALIEVAVVFAIWLLYFSRSVRVRTYFASDEYLRRSIFLKNCAGPNPID